MELLKPKFLVKGYGYYNDDELQIKDYAPQWAKDEYEEFMKKLNSNAIEDTNRNNKSEELYLIQDDRFNNSTGERAY